MAMAGNELRKEIVSVKEKENFASKSSEDQYCSGLNKATILSKK